MPSVANLAESMDHEVDPTSTYHTEPDPQLEVETVPIYYGRSPDPDAPPTGRVGRVTILIGLGDPAPI